MQDKKRIQPWTHGKSENATSHNQGDIWERSRCISSGP